MQIYALYFIILLYFCDQEDGKATNFCPSFALIQIKFLNKHQMQRAVSQRSEPPGTHSAIAILWMTCSMMLLIWHLFHPAFVRNVS